MRALAIPLSAAALLIAACGSGSGDGEERTAKRTPTPSASTGGATPEATPAAARGVARAQRVITGWSDALRRSDVDRATSFFAVPLLVSQGAAGLLTSRSRVREFNDGLPCGSRVTGVSREKGYFVASFELTERPGKRCDAPGATARVAFKLRGDRIREWRQLLEQGPSPELESS